ncbi:hypothetical protein Dxin01_00211 [Deinococcus xinjiangensis]|uniref:Uncharacterized protein n=1 Tax=Deinococcus xinjiangensis TaxID=457454 RepID=A0ABP9V5C2_9DEIO
MTSEKRRATFISLTGPRVISYWPDAESYYRELYIEARLGSHATAPKPQPLLRSSTEIHNTDAVNDRLWDEDRAAFWRR